MLAAKLVQAEGSAPPRDLRMWPPVSIQAIPGSEAMPFTVNSPVAVWRSRCLQSCLPELMYSLYVLSPGCATHFVKLIKISGPFLMYHKGSHRGMGNDN